MCNLKNAVILVIDDCEDNRFLLETILVQDGYQVETAGSGQEGIEKIHQLIPDLVILDLMMPQMTGLEAIERIKPFEHLSQIPILICTANAYIAEQELQDADSICYKPIDIEDVLTKVDSLIACCDTINKSTIILNADR